MWHGVRTALRECVSDGRGFSFMCCTWKSESTSRMPYFDVSAKASVSRFSDLTSQTEATYIFNWVCDWKSLKKKFDASDFINNEYFHTGFPGFFFSFLKSDNPCSPSSLHWYVTTKFPSSLFFCTSANRSVNFLRLKSSLNSVSLEKNTPLEHQGLFIKIVLG